MIQKMIVKTDGLNYIGRVRQHRGYIFKKSSVRSEKSKKFDKFYYEAQYNNIPEEDLLNYIQNRFWETADDIIDDTVDDVEVSELYDRFIDRQKKKLKLCREKAYMLKPNYWVTFTYSDKKETPESFEKGLITLFNNLSKRNGWKVIGGWEKGDVGSRSHFHALIFVPEGKMIGELVARSRYSRKNHRREIYTDNTYFSERFGISDWVAIEPSDLRNGRIINYLTDYIFKSGRRLFYSRGIANEIEVNVDTDNDIFMSYYHHGVHHIFYQSKFNDRTVFFDIVDKANMFSFDIEYIGFNDTVTFVPMIS